MALRFVEPAAGVLRSYERGLEEITGASPPDDSAVHAPVVTYAFEALLRGATIADQLPSGCRFYARYPSAPGTIASEMTNPSDYGKADFRALLEGERAVRGWVRIDQLSALPALVAADHDLYVISIPSLFIDAFLLRPSDGSAADQVAPLDLLADVLDVPVLQPLGVFLQFLQPLAQQRLAPADDPLLP